MNKPVSAHMSYLKATASAAAAGSYADSSIAASISCISSSSIIRIIQGR
ncbi:hypothetical protein [Undibacterium terreum]|nr:hypothetical protein [Undibacterium terreum]